ncbi:MAG: HPr family phosphocarrier protein [Fusobacteriaceae bacterium]
MKSIIVEIKNKAGLHARPSSLFVQVASEFEAEILVKCDEEEINGKSIMGLMLLAAEQGRKLVLEADGEDEDQLLEALRELVEVKKFNEE